VSEGGHTCPQVSHLMLAGCAALSLTLDLASLDRWAEGRSPWHLWGQISSCILILVSLAYNLLILLTNQTCKLSVRDTVYTAHMATVQARSGCVGRVWGNGKL
jgi:hypothetical protein